MDPLWGELFPAQQDRILALLGERLYIGSESINVQLQIDGLRGFGRELQADDTRNAV